MPVFKMQGRPVKSFKLYRELFNPYDVLRQRESMAAFAQGHMQLNDAMRYHVAMAGTAVCGQLLRGAAGWTPNAGDVEVYPAPGSYWKDELNAAPRNVDVDEKMEQSLGTLVEDMSAWCAQNIEDEALCARLCLLLTAAYALAETDLSAHPLEKEQVLIAWERRKPAVQESAAAEMHESAPEQRKECVLPADTEELIPTVVLAPDPAPYVCAVFDGKFSMLSQRIRTYRIEADSRSAFGVNAEVVLDVGGETVNIRRGEHVYVNAVDGAIVRVLPETVENAGNTLELEGGAEDDLSLSFGDTLRMMRFAPGQKVTSFAMGETPDSILIIRDNRLCIDYFAQRGSFMKLQLLQERKVVEVQIIGGHYVVLQDNGRVYSSSNRFNGLKNVTTLKDIEIKWQQYREEEG